MLIKQQLDGHDLGVQMVKCMYPVDARGRSVVFIDTPAFYISPERVRDSGKKIMRWINKT